MCGIAKWYSVRNQSIYTNVANNWKLCTFQAIKCTRATCSFHTDSVHQSVDNFLVALSSFLFSGTTKNCLLSTLIAQVIPHTVQLEHTFTCTFITHTLRRRVLSFCSHIQIHKDQHPKTTYAIFKHKTCTTEKAVNNYHNKNSFS